MSAKKSVTFRLVDGNEDFSVIFDVSDDGRRLESSKSATEAFIGFLKSLGIINDDVSIKGWTNSINEVEYNNPISSIKIRKKAKLLGFEVVPGKSFETRKAESLKRAKQ